jgi:hypothetical protein
MAAKGLRAAANRRKRREVSDERKQLRNEGLHNLYSSPNITGIMKQNEMKEAYTTHWKDKKWTQNYNCKT